MERNRKCFHAFNEKTKCDGLEPTHTNYLSQTKTNTDETTNESGQIPVAIFAQCVRVAIFAQCVRFLVKLKRGGLGKAEAATNRKLFENCEEQIGFIQSHSEGAQEPQVETTGDVVVSTQPSWIIPQSSKIFLRRWRQRHSDKLINLLFCSERDCRHHTPLQRS